MNVLVCDDDPGFREMVRLRLEMDGHQVADAASAWDGYRMAQLMVPDWIITDGRMPRHGDGSRLCFMVKTARLPSKVVVWSGAPEEEWLARSAGCDRFFVKSEVALTAVRSLLKTPTNERFTVVGA